MPPDLRSAPGCTYRVQLNSAFRFSAAAALVPYLAELGVTHLYCSPILQAAPGSAHGYDVVDPGRISDELGGPDGLNALSGALGDAGLGMIVDVVPNHMATAGRDNPWWWDVLENGPSSVWARAFDIDWDPPEAKLRQRVLVPVLGDHYGRVLEAGEIRVRREGGSFLVSYFDHELPVSPRTLDEVLADAAVRSGRNQLAELARGFARLPDASLTDRDSVARRHEEKETLRARLDSACRADPALAEAVDAAVERFNSDPDRLDTLLGRQNYRLARWQVAGYELDYRRFFDVTGLIALRIEDPRVFEDTHALIIRLVEEGVVDGLRIDHPDGLRDPTGYLERLEGATGGAWTVVEKILEAEEDLAPGWPVAGTTGYDFLNVVGGLFVDPDGEAPLSDLYRRFTGDELDFEETGGQGRREILDTSLAAELERLTALAVEVCEGRRRYRDFSRVELRAALREALVEVGVYRTYVRPDGSRQPLDDERIRAALQRAREARPDLDPELFDLLGLVLPVTRRAPAEVDLAMRFQQVAGAVTAKGVEDTAFYRYLRLAALNEVGGDPGRFGVGPAAFHAHNERMARDWPTTMTASSTHDTKRAEDVRARLALLSEIPDEWAAAVARWSALADRHRSGALPDRRADYLLFQTLVGAHPLPSDRARAYMEKAAREAKAATSWTAPDAEYEGALAKLVDGLLADPDMTRDLEAFVAPLVPAGRRNSLAQTLLKLTSPGVPDIYQGCEVWDLSLVDPDNRRPVDHARIRGLLTDCRRIHASAGGPGIMERSDDGLPKLFLTWRALGVRAEVPAAFTPGAAYEPLAADGPRSNHVVAFGRAGRVVAVAPRLVLGLARAGGFGATTLALPPGTWTDRLSGAAWSGRVGMTELLDAFPVALLVRD
ncbi:MAG TPA: malto-oligosyltrehalose synthase [Acidimicrobiales bacterium]|nr:malto-oligosyltrehalose synthase [Acidimicrobiales bacterium]